MKKFLPILFLFFSACAIAQVEKAIPSKPPASAGLVHDYTKARLITQQQEEFLEQKLQRYNDSTSNQIAIVILEGLKGYEANEFARAIGEVWGVGGQANFDNGIVILITTGGDGEKRVAYIATGRGMEGVIPDITAKHIVDNEIISNFKKGEFFRGFDEATDAIIKAAAGEYKAPKGYGSKAKKIGGVIKTIVIIIIILIVISSRGNRGGGGMVSRRGYGDIGTGWIIGSLLGGAGRGGSGGGGSSGGGGFGGFGGGSFGGGGAGGSW
jgi:uncharacterized protein